MADEVKYASCPACGRMTFKYLDTDPEGDYPRCLFECTDCHRMWKETQLKGIEWIEVPF